MCLRFVFLLITRVASWLRLSRREETWKTAEILILRHQLAVLQRRQPRRPKLDWADRALLATLLSVIPKARRHGLRLLVTPDKGVACGVLRRRFCGPTCRYDRGQRPGDETASREVPALPRHLSARSVPCGAWWTWAELRQVPDLRRSGRGRRGCVKRDVCADGAAGVARHAADLTTCRRAGYLGRRVAAGRPVAGGDRGLPTCCRSAAPRASWPGCGALRSVQPKTSCG